MQPRRLDIEAGRVVPTVGLARKLSRGLGVPIEVLVGADDCAVGVLEAATRERHRAVERFVEVVRTRRWRRGG